MPVCDSHADAHLDADAGLLTALRAGDETAFAMLVARHQPSMLRVAQGFVRDTQAAEEVVQETWLALVAGLAGFEGRSSLRTWLFRILTNRAITCGVREARTTPFSALAGDGTAAAPSGQPLPEDQLVAVETLERLHAAIDRLPAGQREIIRLRDIEGRPAGEVCARLALTAGNQRVLLHRARTQVRAVLAGYLEST